ncbi:hypothetical protein BB561_001132 [Smittium simulii]|uniref:Mitochondrial distribution and morphology protein 31 n=1 Tax=Smittium simulii TaxID=133385 RepID=A0A2T9YW03_9FUNG|nr:hypothetical protein BB561_001132 [Smittium simulii]
MLPFAFQYIPVHLRPLLSIQALSLTPKLKYYNFSKIISFSSYSNFTNISKIQTAHVKLSTCHNIHKPQFYLPLFNKKCSSCSFNPKIPYNTPNSTFFTNLLVKKLSKKFSKLILFDFRCFFTNWFLKKPLLLNHDNIKNFFTAQFQINRPFLYYASHFTRNFDVKDNYSFKKYSKKKSLEYKLAGVFLFLASVDVLPSNEVILLQATESMVVNYKPPCLIQNSSCTAHTRKNINSLSQVNSHTNLINRNQSRFYSIVSPGKKSASDDKKIHDHAKLKSPANTFETFETDGHKKNSIVKYSKNSITVFKEDYFRYKLSKPKIQNKNTAKVIAKATKSILLAETDGRFKRLLVHIQFIFRGGSAGRPWTIDEFFALGSWLLMSNVLWILVGTTTFVSVVLFILNNLNFQPTVSSLVGTWISRATGISFTIKSAILPKWGNGRITLKNIKVECGPEHAIFKEIEEKGLISQESDLNFTYYMLFVDEVDIELSLVRWIDGKGLVKSCNVKGVRGVIDQRHLKYDDSKQYIPANERALHRPGYFDFDFVEVEDIMFTILYPNFRPVPVAIHYGTIGKLRQQWFFYDIMNAVSIVGMYDNSLFTIRKIRQLQHDISDLSFSNSKNNYETNLGHELNPNHYNLKNSLRINGRPYYSLDSNLENTKSNNLHSATHVKIDNLDISHLNYGVDGPIGWITSGRVDIDSTLLFPNQTNFNASDVIEKLFTDLSESIDVVVLPSQTDLMYPEQSDSFIIKFLYNSGLFKTKPVQKIKQKIMNNFDNESNRRLKLQRERTLQWVSDYNNVPENNIANTTNLGKNKLSANQTNLENSQKDTDAQGKKSFNDFANYLQSSRYVLVDLNVEFNNLRASVPLTTPHLSYLNSTLLVRPIVAYMNRHRVNIPIKCKIKLDVGDFDGSWNAYDSGVVDLISEGMGRAFAQLIKDENERSRRLKLIGMWSVSTIAKQSVTLLENIFSLQNFR